MRWIWIVIIFVLIASMVVAFKGGEIKVIKEQENIEAQAYVNYLGDRARDMSIGGDAYAYDTLVWARDNNIASKDEMKAHYESLGNDLNVPCEAIGTTKGCVLDGEGYWAYINCNGKRFICLPQICHSASDTDIFINGRQYACSYGRQRYTPQDIKNDKKFYDKFIAMHKCIGEDFWNMEHQDYCQQKYLPKMAAQELKNKGIFVGGYMYQRSK